MTTDCRAFTLGLLASTALATPALAQDRRQPQTTGQSPAPGTNATDVTAPPPAAAGAGRQGPRPDRDHRHRDQARGESAECADQRPGARHAAARPAEHLELRGLHQAAAVGAASRRAAAGRHDRLHARRRLGRRRQPLRARCRRSAPISTSSRSRRSAARSTSTSTTSPGSRPRRAAGHALRRLERSRHDPHHHQQARARRDRPGASTASSTRSPMAASGGKLEGMINLPLGSRDRVPRRRLLPARRRLYRQHLRLADLLRRRTISAPTIPTMHRLRQQRLDVTTRV